MSQRKPTPGEIEASHSWKPLWWPSHMSDEDRIRCADCVLALADRIRRERKEQEKQR